MLRSYCAKGIHLQHPTSHPQHQVLRLFHNVVFDCVVTVWYGLTSHLTLRSDSGATAALARFVAAASTKASSTARPTAQAACFTAPLS